MKILHIITSLKIGGAESNLVNFLEESKKNKDYKHYVAYFYDGPNVEQIKKLEIPLFKINGLFFKYDLFAYLKLKNIIKKIKPDVLHSALWSSNIFARILSKKFKIPVMCDLHSNFEHDGKIRQFLEKPFLNMATKYIAVSNTTKNGFEKTFKIKNKPHLILNGINAQKIKEKSEQSNIQKEALGFNKNDFVIGTVGRLVKIKQQDILIKSFALALDNITNKNIKLCIIGDGPEHSNLSKLAKNLRIENFVTFLGQKDCAYKYYKIFDCFALPSASEGLSIALLEALAFGLPIITTSTTSEHDVIKNNINGIIVPPGKICDLQDAIFKLYKDPALSSKIKANNLELINTKFSISRTVALYHEQYKAIKNNNY